MKFLLILTFIFSIQLTAKGQIKPDSLPIPAKARDFNFTFYPSENYFRAGEFWRIDSTTLSPDGKKLTPSLRQFTDTSSAKIQAVVVKEGDQIKIVNILDQTQVHYKSGVRFLGVTTDGTNALTYQSLSANGEFIFVNPITGFVIVSFNVPLTSNPKKFNTNIHYFGNVPLRLAAKK